VTGDSSANQVSHIGASTLRTLLTREDDRRWSLVGMCDQVSSKPVGRLKIYERDTSDYGQI
jgi:hypothetical protein